MTVSPVPMYFGPAGEGGRTGRRATVPATGPVGEGVPGIALQGPLFRLPKYYTVERSCSS